MAQGNVFKSSAAAKMAKALRKKKAAANKHGRGGMTTKRGERREEMECFSNEEKGEKRKKLFDLTSCSLSSKNSLSPSLSLSLSLSIYLSISLSLSPPGMFVCPPKKLALLKKAAEEKV